MYRTRNYVIRKHHRLHAYCASKCSGSAALYSRANFLVRQYATAVRDFESMKPLHPNQMEAYRLAQSMTAGTKYAPKDKWMNINTVKNGENTSSYSENMV